MSAVKREEKELEIPDYLAYGEVVILDGKKLFVTEASYLVSYNPEEETDYPENYVVYNAYTEDNQQTEFTSLDKFSKTGKIVNEEEIMRRSQASSSKIKANIDAIWEENLRRLKEDGAF